ncbi:MAG: hypothetical protein K2H93_03205, partial [Oscillospiraceae bacterium]|nr:hypothetical protein [Oscillospiraceae bacterium]
MKKVISALTAAVMTASMSASVISAFAEYTADNIGYYLKVTSEGNYTLSDDGKTITFAKAEDAAGATFTVGSYIVADTANPTIQQVGGIVQVSNNLVHLPQEGSALDTEGYITAFTFLDIIDEPANGSIIYGSSDLFNWEWEENQVFDWVFSFDAINDPRNDGLATDQRTAYFYGEKSDSYPVTEFEVSLDAAIKDGTYTIDFIDGYTDPYARPQNDGTYIADFRQFTLVNTNGSNIIIPKSLEGLTIKVGDASVTPDPTDPDPTDPDPTDPDPTDPDPTDPNPGPSDKVHDGFEWYIDDVVYDPENDTRVELPIRVWGDPGTTGVECVISIDGKTVDDDDCPFKVLTIKNDKAYQKFAAFTANPAMGSLVAAQSSGKVENELAQDGASVMTYYLQLKDGATLKGPGEKYVVDFANLKVADETEGEITPKKTAGSITIAGEGTPDPTTPDPTTPDPTTPDPTEPDPTTTPSAEGFKWYIEDATYDPATGDRFNLLFKVTNDPGTTGYEFGITIDGKKVTDADCPFKVLAIKDSKEAYQKLGAWQSNPEKGKISAAQTEGKVQNEVAANDSAVLYYVLEAKEGATFKGAGEKYEVKFDNLVVGDENEARRTPDTDSGYIIIAGEEATEPTPTEPTPTEKPFEHQEKQVDAEWIIGNDTVAPGATVTIPVSVKGNTDGFNSYIAKIKTEKPALTDSANGKVSDNLSFVSNAQNMTFSGTNFTTNGETVTGDGDVFYMTFTAPTEPGKYDITFDNLEIYDIGMVRLIPKTTNGWIEVKADETEFNHEKKDTNAKWVIGKEEVEAGATVQIPVSVEGASDIADGINSYIVKIKQDAGPTATNASSGTAYSELGLTQNLAELIFAGTNSDKKENIATADGDVFYIEFKVPDDAAPGTTYNLSFADIELENMDMVQLIPKTEDGWIKVKAAETTTTTEPPVVSDAGKWIIGHDTVAPGATVTIPVTVTGDKNGINSFKMTMGKDNAVTANSSEKGSAYEPLGYVYNLDNMSFAGTNHELDKNIIPEDGSVVFYVTFTAPT